MPVLSVLSVSALSAERATAVASIVGLFSCGVTHGRSFRVNGQAVFLTLSPTTFDSVKRLHVTNAASLASRIPHGSLGKCVPLAPLDAQRS